MIYLAAFILLILSACLSAFGWRALQNHREISRLRRNGYRRVAARRLVDRGSVDHDFLRGIVELLLLILLLAAVLGWLAHSDPHPNSFP